MRLRVSFVILFIYPLHLWSLFLFTTLYSFASYLTISLLQLHSFTLKFHISLFTPFSCFSFFPPVPFPFYPFFLLILILSFSYHFHILPKFFFNLHLSHLSTVLSLFYVLPLFLFLFLLYSFYIFLSFLIHFHAIISMLSFLCCHFYAIISMLIQFLHLASYLNLYVLVCLSYFFCFLRNYSFSCMYDSFPALLCFFLSSFFLPILLSS